MNAPAWRRLLVPAATVLALGSMAWWFCMPRPTLDGVNRLISSGRLDVAERRLIDYIRANPDDQDARLTLARVSVDRPDPRPDLALEQLRGLRPADARSAAEAKAIEGEALFANRRYDAAEAAWLEAIRLDPKVPEVGFRLLSLYALQGRDDDSRRLALRLFDVEPDPADRVQLLLQLIRHDAHAIELGSIVHELEPVVRGNPGDVRSALALGLALVKVGRHDEGLAMLRRAVESRGELPEARDAYLSGLREAGRFDDLARALGDLPPAMSDDPRFDATRGAASAHRLDWPTAVRQYRHALEARPSDAALAYRLSLVLRNGVEDAEAGPFATRLKAVAEAYGRLRDLYDRLAALPDVAATSNRGIYAEVAATLGPLGRGEEARAWNRLARGIPPGKLPGDVTNNP